MGKKMQQLRKAQMQKAKRAEKKVKPKKNHLGKRLNGAGPLAGTGRGLAPPILRTHKNKITRQADAKLRTVEAEKVRQREIRGKAKLLEVKRSLSQQDQLLSLVSGASQRSQEHSLVAKLTPIGDGVKTVGDSGMANDASRRHYYREFKQVMEASDVILEVLDARDPMGCRCLEAERMFRATGANKKIVLVLNKIDLVPKQVVTQWLKVLRNEFPTIAFKANTQQQQGNLSRNDATNAARASDWGKNRSECLGADTLIQLLKNYSRSQDVKVSISVGVVGFPNVGKSSLINSLKRSKATNVGSTPGLTKVAQEVHLDKKVKLLDSPGIVFTATVDAATALRNCVKIEKLDDPITPIGLILERCNHEQLAGLYRLRSTFTNTTSFLLQIAQQKGKMKKKGLYDLETAARMVLEDWNSGRIPYFTMPPEETAKPGTHLDAQVVNGWGADFDLDALVVRNEEEIDAQLDNETDARAFAAVRGGGSMIVDSASTVAAAPSLVLASGTNWAAVNTTSGAGRSGLSESESVSLHLGSRKRLGTRRLMNGEAAGGTGREVRKLSRAVGGRPATVTGGGGSEVAAAAVTNPQTNQMIKKLQKIQRRDERRTAAAAADRAAAANMMQAEDDDDVNPTFDFGGGDGFGDIGAQTDDGDSGGVGMKGVDDDGFDFDDYSDDDM